MGVVAAAGPYEFTPVGAPALFRKRAWSDTRGRSERAFVVAMVAWLPLVLLCAFEPGARNALARDAVLHTRLLATLPLLLLIEPLISRRLRPVPQHLIDSGLVPEQERGKLWALLRDLERRRDSRWTYLGLWALALAPSLAPDPFASLWAAPAWASSANGLAWLWHNAVSAPIFRFLVLRWLFWAALWGVLMVRVARLEGLRVWPTHPDGMCGIRLLNDCLTSFLWLSFALALPVAMRSRALFGPAGTAEVPTYLIPLGVLGGFVAVVLFGPLWAFAPRLLKARRLRSFQLHALSAQQHRVFHARWLAKRPEDQMVVERGDEFSFLTDLNSGFETFRGGRWIPVAVRPVLTVAGGAVAAAVPLLMLDRSLLRVAMHIAGAFG